MFEEIKEKAPLRLKDIPALAEIAPDTFNSWSAGRLPVPDYAFPLIAEALEKKAAELKRLAKAARKHARQHGSPTE